MTAWWTIYKLDYQGRPKYSWKVRLLHRDEAVWLFEGYMELKRPVRVGGLLFQPGDRVLEAYFPHRWYNVVELYQGKHGPLQGWYANLARPARLAGPYTLVYEDLDLDLVVLIDGTMEEVDREGFEALPLKAPERHRALRDWQVLKQAFAQGEVHLAQRKLPEHRLQVSGRSGNASQKGEA